MTLQGREITKDNIELVKATDRSQSNRVNIFYIFILTLKILIFLIYKKLLLNIIIYNTV